MKSIDLSGLEKFSQDIDDLQDRVLEARRTLHEDIANIAKEEVDRHIDYSVKDSSSRITDLQEQRYAAIRATNAKTGANSSEAVTNYLESGHGIRSPSGKSKGYKPNIRVPYVDGRHFHGNASRRVVIKAISKAEEFLEELARKIER